jgi:hypothetical protein
LYISFDRGSHVITVSGMGQCAVFRDQEVILSNLKLPMDKVNLDAVVVTYVEGEPWIGVAGYGKGAGVYLRHAVTLGQVRSLPYKEDVYCVCINATKLFFGTYSGWL